MSNANVGHVYDTIMNDVLESSRVDFEECGIDESVALELKKVWQEKLSKLQVASFPWDPKPEAATPAPPAPANAPPVPAGNYTQATLSPPTGAAALTMPNVASAPSANGLAIKPEAPVSNGDLAIKQEPGPQNLPMPTYMGPASNIPANVNGVPSLAHQRAAQQLQVQFGTRAAASISALKGGPPNSQAPRLNLPQNAQNAEQYRQQQAAANAAQLHQVHPQQQPQQVQNGSSVGASQVDGPGEDYEAVMMERDANGNLNELGRVELDHMLHDKIAARAKRMEGGGLMLPLKAASSKRSRRAAAAAATQADSNAVAASSSSSSSAAVAAFAQLDGMGDEIKDEEDLDDAINSDLDDPENDVEDSDDDDERIDQQMLCLYDKVQRVKNKWKCTLKDGILTVNGKEYVFHKATGEYEW